jgi:hypothetical protein
MKKNTLYQIVDFKINLISAQQILSLSIKRVLLILMFFISFVNISAQNVKSLEQFQAEADYSEKTYFQSLFDKESINSIHDGKIELDSNSAINVIVVDLNSIDILYSQNSKFESVELIKIVLKNSRDINSRIDLSKLNYLRKMKYILIATSIEVCPENEDNRQCQLSKIQNMFLPSQNVNPTILLRIVTPM